jgi:hypothetical protein
MLMAIDVSTGSVRFVLDALQVIRSPWGRFDESVTAVTKLNQGQLQVHKLFGATEYENDVSHF